MKRKVFGILIALVLVLSFGFTVPALSNPISPNVFVDIKPTSCPNPLNVKQFRIRKAVLAVAILGTDDLDVKDVYPRTVRINLPDNGVDMELDSVDNVVVAPLRWAYEDVATPYTNCNYCHELGPDGYLDLVLMFRTSDVVDELELSGYPDGEVVELEITGEKFDEGGYIIGWDTIVIINKTINGEG